MYKFKDIKFYSVTVPISYKDNHCMMRNLKSTFTQPFCHG